MKTRKSPISIAICAFNAIEYTRLLVDSIRRHSRYDHEILIYSDGSSDDTAAWLKDQKDLTWQHDRRNRGICTAMNLVAKMATRDYLFFPNTDHVVAPGWDEALIPRLSRRRVVSLQCIEPGTVPVASIFHARNCGTRWDEFDERAFHGAVAQLSDRRDTPGINYPFIISKELWKEVGGLDERFDPGPANDPDLFYRLGFVGAEMVRAEDVIIYHFSGKSSRMAGEVNQERSEWHAITDRNEARFVDKWGERYQYSNGGLPNPGPEAHRRWREMSGTHVTAEVSTPLRMGIDARSIAPRMGGIGIYTKNLIQALAKLKNGPILHCVTGDAEEFKRCVGSSENILIVPTQVPQGMDLSRESALSDLPIKIFHGPAFAIPSALNRPSVATVHDLAFIRYPQWYPEDFVRHMRSGVDHSVASAAALIAVSDATEVDLKEIYPQAAGRIRRIYEALPEEARIRVGTAAMASTKARYVGDADFILSVGVQQKRKNALRLVHAFARLKDRLKSPYKLLLVGGLECEDPRLTKEIQTLNLTADVVLTSHLPSEELAALYASCRLFVYPSLQEGFGLPVLEAMWHGAPVVCSDARALREVAGDAARYFRAGDVEEMAETMSKILQEPPLATDLIARGKLRVEAFSWERAAQETMEVYRAAIETAPAAVPPPEFQARRASVATPSAQPRTRQASSRPRIAIDARLLGQDRLGTGKYSTEIIRALIAHVKEADFVLIGPSVLPPDFLPEGASIFQHIPVGMDTLLNPAWEQFSLSAHLLGCDLYLSPTGILPVARPCKAIPVIHDLGFIDHPDHFDPAVRGHLDRWIRAACQSADLIVTVSDFTRERVSALFDLPADRMKVVHHGRSRKRGPAHELRQRTGKEGETPYVLCVSSFEPNKNLVLLVEAFSRVSRSWKGSLVLAGRRGRDLTRVQEAIRKCQLESRIRLVLEASNEEIGALYRGAKVFAYPSLYEGFGLPLLEAMDHGLPVIANRLASCPEVVGEGGVLVDDATPEAWAGALKAVLTQETRVRDLSQAALSRAEQFSWSKAAESTWLAIESCLEGE